MRSHKDTQTVARLGKLVADGGLAVSDVFVVTVLDVLNWVRAGRIFFLTLCLKKLSL